jgi:hypothetical protein
MDIVRRQKANRYELAKRLQNLSAKKKIVFCAGREVDASASPVRASLNASEKLWLIIRRPPDKVNRCDDHTDGRATASLPGIFILL